MIDDHYRVLNVDKSADVEDIKRAYRKLALQYHPDRNVGQDTAKVHESEQQFQKIHNAYKALTTSGTYDTNFERKTFFKSEELQKAFDHFVRQTSISYSNPSFHASTGSINNHQKEPSFTVPPFASLPKSGQTLRTTIRVSFEESVRGCTKIIELKKLALCTACDGHGYPKTAEKLHCIACIGTGVVSQHSSMLTIKSYCTLCKGKGFSVPSKCNSCEDGKLQLKQELKIEVPAGISKGMKKLYKGEGDAGEPGGQPGDLIVNFDVAASSNFRQDGDCAITDLNINFFQAVLGDVVELQGLYKTVQVTIPPGTQPNQVLCIPDHGFTNVKTKKRGALFVRIIVQIPKNVNSKQLALMNEMKLRWEQS
eukprot:TRINITY_DN562_c0_g1_i4.p1 TRINITY_DN562_c0_g1~~TRINITY_DN562_c0_g1_i4.p1  ORF type:complete len:404 (-),score=56.54 TRINITY_DN562_c0_g1_i4:187-1287(-)